MFENISGKIKILAIVSTIVGILASIVCGIVLIAALDEEEIGIPLMILGPLFSWASSFLIYGFGELIENTQVIARNTTKQNVLTKSNLFNKNQSTPHSPSPSTQNTTNSKPSHTPIAKEMKNYTKNIIPNNKLHTYTKCPDCLSSVSGKDSHCGYCGYPLLKEPEKPSRLGKY